MPIWTMQRPAGEGRGINGGDPRKAKLGVSRSTIYRLVHNGELELVKIGKRSSGITATSLHAMIERNKMPC